MKSRYDPRKAQYTFEQAKTSAERAKNPKELQRTARNNKKRKER
jgi:hypothetical protein